MTYELRGPVCVCADRDAPPGADRSPAARPAGDVLLEKTAGVLRRLGLAPDAEDLAAAFVPFVIAREFLHTIPPLPAIPHEYVALPDAGLETQAFAVRGGAAYLNVPLPPVPVASPGAAPFLVGARQDSELAFVDGQNVYGANLFERFEGRRLLRRAVGYLHDELTADGDEIDIISYEADGFLISRRHRRGRAPLEARLREIIARMKGLDAHARDREATRARLGTFYRYARTAVLAPATVAYESRDDLAASVHCHDPRAPRTLGQRVARLEELHASLAPLLRTLSRRAPAEQATALALIEHAVFDPVLQDLAEELSTTGCPVRAFNEPAPLINRLGVRPASFYRLQFVSLLKAVNEHPLGGFRAGNEALRALYRLLVTAIRRALDEAGVGPPHEIHTLRRWGEFFFAVDEGVVDGKDVAAAVERAFDGARYVAIDAAVGSRRGCAAVILATCPAPAAGRIVVPLVPTVTVETDFSDDVLSMPIEQSARKMEAIERRLRGGVVPGVDVVFLADWALNACDPKRGIPRLVNLLHATDAEIDALAGYYESYVSRKGRRERRIKRERRAIRGFEARLRELIQGARGAGPLAKGAL